MRVRQTSLLPKQHWTLLLIFFIALITGILTDDEIQAPLGGSAYFNFTVKKDTRITLAEVSLCLNEKVFVYHPVHGLNTFNNSYAGRLSVKSNNSIILKNLQDSDFVTYCYKLSTFPDGTLHGRINLVKQTSDESGLSNTVIISVGCSVCFVVLCGIIAGVIWYKKRRNSANSALDCGGQKKPKSKQMQNVEEVYDDNNYLNVP